MFWVVEEEEEEEVEVVEEEEEEGGGGRLERDCFFVRYCFMFWIQIVVCLSG